MTHKITRFKIGPLVLAAVTTGLLHGAVYAQPAMQPGVGGMQGGSANPSARSSAATGSGSMGMKGMDMKGMMKEQHDKMSSMPMSGDPDIDFATMMKMHHQGAITMAETELRDGKSPEMKKLAKNIIAAQKKEIAQLDAFLSKKKGSRDK